MANPNRSERILAALAGRAFLRLWSYPNLFTDKGGSKELCDLLVILGTDLVIFSDKDCELTLTGDAQTSWRRWYRRAVLASAKQIRGAERQIREHPDRIFEDAACTRRLEISLAGVTRVHRVATVRGATEAAGVEWGGRGSLIVTNRSLDECEAAPFRVGAVDAQGHFVHVFDNNALEAVLVTLDTAADFLGYLRKREAFLRRSIGITAASEEDLLAYYMMSYDQARNELDFPQTSDTSIFIDSSYWRGWQSSNQRAARDSANEVSYAWDRLTDKFSFHALTRTQHYVSSPEMVEQEKLLRWMGRESRTRRRLLAESLIEMMDTTPIGDLRRRYMPPNVAGDPYWLFLVFPCPPGMPYESYRERRRTMLLGHIYVVRHLNPDALDIVGLAVGHYEREISEDAIYIDCRDWTEELEDVARDLHESNGIFANPQRREKRYREYPV